MATSINYLEQMLEDENIKAVIQTIRYTEGTGADDGYGYLFGSTPNNNIRFTDFSTHPNIHEIHNGINSTAAGIAQILYGTFVELCNKYGFTDFQPHTQELMFCALFDQINVLGDLAKGYYLRDDVQAKIGTIWASQPLSKYGQPTHTIADVRAYYLSVGGSIGGLAV